MKTILKRPGQDLPVKVYRYEFALGIIMLFVSRHISPLFAKRSLWILQMRIWRFYHAFKTFSTDSTAKLRGAAVFCRVPLERLVRLPPVIVVDLYFVRPQMRKPRVTGLPGKSVFGAKAEMMCSRSPSNLKNRT